MVPTTSSGDLIGPKTFINQAKWKQTNKFLRNSFVFSELN